MVPDSFVVLKERESGDLLAALSGVRLDNARIQGPLRLWGHSCCNLDNRHERMFE